jgi:2-hydroxymethylglutarate dehydrogenase
VQNIAFFGLGNMGLPIALNLVRAGLRVTTAVHKNKKGPESLRAAGGFIAPNNESAAADADIIFSIVTDDSALESLLLDKNIIAAVRPGTIIVDMTSCSATAMRKVDNFYKQRGVSVADAPVTGGVGGAAAATMTMFVGCDDDTFKRISPILALISKKQCRVGQVGDGKIVKSFNNLMAASHVLVAAEAVKLVGKNNIDPEMFFDAISNGSGNSTQFQFGFKKMVAEDFSPTFALSLMIKDIHLAMEMADGLNLPLSSMSQKLYEAAAHFGDEDYFAVSKVI